MLILGFLLILLAAAVITYVLLATAGMTAVPISYGVLAVAVVAVLLLTSRKLRRYRAARAGG